MAPGSPPGPWTDTVAGSVRGCTRGAEPGLRADILRFVSFRLVLRGLAAVEHGEQPDADEGDDHREQRRVLVRERGRVVRMQQHLLPYGRTQDDEDHGR